MKKLIITNGTQYIQETESDYCLTTDINKANNFRWYWLFISKKIILEGIRNRFGNQYSYKYIGG